MYCIHTGEPGRNGFVLLAHNKGEILGAVIINDTNMAGYIPEHILVYIAVHNKARGQESVKLLMEKVIDQTHGDIAFACRQTINYNSV